jgi:hypothetical protein
MDFSQDATKEEMAWQDSPARESFAIINGIQAIHSSFNNDHE